MTKQQATELDYSKRLGDAIVLLSLAGVMTQGERQKATKRYTAMMARRGVTVTPVNIAGKPIREQCGICSDPNCDEPNGKH